ncbi:MAG: hypothetical protein WD492_18070, partial [Alkalispirochaeta sp.]
MVLFQSIDMDLPVGHSSILPPFRGSVNCDIGYRQKDVDSNPRYERTTFQGKRQMGVDIYDLLLD